MRVGFQSRQLSATLGIGASALQSVNQRFVGVPAHCAARHALALRPPHAPTVSRSWRAALTWWEFAGCHGASGAATQPITAAASGQRQGAGGGAGGHSTAPKFLQCLSMEVNDRVEPRVVLACSKRPLICPQCTALQRQQGEAPPVVPSAAAAAGRGSAIGAFPANCRALINCSEHPRSLQLPDKAVA